MANQQPMNDDDRADIVAYLDGELEADAQRRIEARLNTDANARSEADSLKRAWEFLDYLPRAEPSLDFTERTLDRVSALQVSKPPGELSATIATAIPWYRQKSVGVATWIAASLLAVVIGYAVTPGPKPAAVAEIDPDTDPLVLHEPRLIENLPLYLAAENLDYLNQMDKSDLFSDETIGR